MSHKITIFLIGFILILGSSYVQAAGKSRYSAVEHDLSYIHTWKPMIPVTGTDLYTGKPTTISGQKGTSYIIFFLSSWCTSCVAKLDQVKKLQDTHSKLYTKMIYAFSHDTLEDATSFSKKHDIEKDSILVDDATIGHYSNPQLPTIFVIDRNSWIIDAFDSLEKKNLEDIDELFNLINAY